MLFNRRLFISSSMLAAGGLTMRPSDALSANTLPSTPHNQITDPAIMEMLTATRSYGKVTRTVRKGSSVHITATISDYTAFCDCYSGKHLSDEKITVIDGNTLTFTRRGTNYTITHTT